MIAVVLRLLKMIIFTYVVYLSWFIYHIRKYNLYKPLSEKIQRVKDNNITYFGSCGWIAYLTSDYLDKNNEKYEIHEMYDSDESNMHIFISTDNFIFDYYGFHPKYINMYSVFKTRKISKEELYNMIYKNKWNKKFNKSDTVLLKSIFYD